MEGYVGGQFVGIDLHRRRSVVVRTTAAGEVLEAVQIANCVDRLRDVIARAGECPEVVLEATYGWYWVAEAWLGGRARVQLAHPLGEKAFEFAGVFPATATGDRRPTVSSGSAETGWPRCATSSPSRSAARSESPLLTS